MKNIPFIIAELGTSHGKDIEKAKELIAAAAEAGADCIKCQIVFADEIIHQKTGIVELPGGPTPLYEVFKNLENDEFFYMSMKNEAQKHGICFLATPFGLKSASLLKNLGSEAVKIASPELNYINFIKEIASWGKPIYISAGISTLGDIEEAILTIKESFSRNSAQNTEITLLHCVTSYPAPPEDYNLRVLPHLAGIFGVNVGVSDHSLDPVLVPVLVSALGAVAIEKHFCLSRTDHGLDDKIALEPPAFTRMCSSLKQVVALDSAQIIAEMEAEYGTDLVEKTLGNGIKTLALSEIANYGLTNRSIHAVCDISEGEIIKPEMIAILRTEKNLRPGLHPRWEKPIIGRKARKTIPSGEGIRFEDI